jgi:DNA polymerase-3 subunit epsilon
MPREIRLSLPKRPGVYRMLRMGGDVLYVGKASSLHNRVNSHFRKQQGVDERMLEMLSQARAISFDVAATPLEAALLETDEIKRHRPPYNLALTLDDRAVWFASPHLCEHSPCPSERCPLGPIASVEILEQFQALTRADRVALGSDRWGPDAATFDAGYERLRAMHPELSRLDLSSSARLLRMGTRLWREGRRDGDVNENGDAADTDGGVSGWTPELVQVSLEWLALRAALARRRAMWLTRLVDASVMWREPGAAGSRLIVIEGGEVVLSTDADPAGAPPIPPGYRRPVIVRRERFTIACFDRLRVLTTELKRLAGAGVPVAVRFGVAPSLADARLAAALWWV